VKCYTFQARVFCAHTDHLTPFSLDFSIFAEIIHETTLKLLATRMPAQQIP
jgi:hypothetical protein